MTWKTLMETDLDLLLLFEWNWVVLGPTCITLDCITNCLTDNSRKSSHFSNGNLCFVNSSNQSILQSIRKSSQF